MSRCEPYLFPITSLQLRNYGDSAGLHPSALNSRSIITVRAPLPCNRRASLKAGNWDLEWSSPIVIASQSVSLQVGIVSAMAKAAWFRTVLGFIVAPVSPGLLAVILAAPFRIGAVGVGVRELSEAAWIIGLSAVLGYPVAVVFGAPLYVFLRARGWNGLFAYIAAGALLGLVIYVIYVLLAEYSSNGLWGLATKFSSTALVQVPLVMICGAVATLVFWLITRPDRNGLVTG